MDRNRQTVSAELRVFPSLSARRAWIEMTYVVRLPRAQVVALRKESVDRNRLTKKNRPPVGVALRKESVDRNYIIKITAIAPRRVALRKESVDRNACIGFH